MVRYVFRNGIKFPDGIHSLKPAPVTFRQEPNRIFDFMSQTPESMLVGRTFVGPNYLQLPVNQALPYLCHLQKLSAEVLAHPPCQSATLCGACSAPPGGLYHWPRSVRELMLQA